MDLRLAMRQCFLLRRKEKTLLISFLLKEKTNGPLPPSQKKNSFNFFNSKENKRTSVLPRGGNGTRTILTQMIQL